MYRYSLFFVRSLTFAPFLYGVSPQARLCHVHFVTAAGLRSNLEHARQRHDSSLEELQNFQQSELAWMRDGCIATTGVQKLFRNYESFCQTNHLMADESIKHTLKQRRRFLQEAYRAQEQISELGVMPDNAKIPQKGAQTEQALIRRRE